MENQLVIKPIGWRYYLRKIIIASIGTALGYAIIFPISILLRKPFPLDILLGTFLILLIFYTLVAYSDKELFDIVVFDGYLSGTKMNTRQEQGFRLKDFDQQSFQHQSFLEKIEGNYILRSRDGARILFIPYIYGEEQAQKLRQIFEQNRDKS